MIEHPEIGVAGALFEVVDIVAPEDTDRDGRASGGMARDHLPLREIFDHQSPATLLFHADCLGEAYVLHQMVKMGVVVPDPSRVRGFVVVLLQKPVGSLRINGVLVNIHDR